jgi:hypothetical protein
MIARLPIVARRCGASDGGSAQPRQLWSFIMTGRLMSVAALTFALATAAAAQEKTVERTVKAAPNKDVRIGVYINVKSDCSSGPLPTVRLTSPPSHGKVTVKNAKVRATNYKQCLALQVPGYVAFYRAAANFSGSDTLTLEVKFESGRSEIQRITVMVGGAGGQPI